MFRIFKTTLLGIGFFILCHCANEHINNAKSINSTFSFTRKVDSDEGLIKAHYFSPDKLNFTIEEVDVLGTKIDGLPQKSKELEGCLGVHFMTEVDLPEKKISMKKDAVEFTIKTKWQGESSKEQIEQFLLPPSFAVESITSELSSTQPIHIKFKEKLLATDWNDCGLYVEDGQNKDGRRRVLDIFSAQSPATSSFQEADIEFEKVKDAFRKTDLDIPLLQITVRCYKNIETGNSVLSYVLESAPFLVNVHH